jgi:hypothetical protein
MVTRIADDLVSVSLGSDQGVAKGQTLHVYRTQPEAIYLGTLRVIDASSNQGVGRSSPRTEKGKEIRVGDRVTNQLLDK